MWDSKEELKCDGFYFGSLTPLECPISHLARTLQRSFFFFVFNLSSEVVCVLSKRHPMMLDMYPGFVSFSTTSHVLIVLKTGSCGVIFEY